MTTFIYLFILPNLGLTCGQRAGPRRQPCVSSDGRMSWIEESPHKGVALNDSTCK